MERKRVEEFVKSLRLRLWMNQSCISLGFLSQKSLWKLSQYRGNEGTCLARVQLLATCKPRVTREIQSRDSVSLHNLEHFFTLSHSLPLQVSHLNTGLLNAKLQANWHRIKPTRWLIKFNLTISPFGYSVTKPYNRL